MGITVANTNKEKLKSPINLVKHFVGINVALDVLPEEARRKHLEYLKGRKDIVLIVLKNSIRKSFKKY